MTQSESISKFKPVMLVLRIYLEPLWILVARPSLEWSHHWSIQPLQWISCAIEPELRAKHSPVGLHAHARGLPCVVDTFKIVPPGIPQELLEDCLNPSAAIEAELPGTG